MTALLLDPIYQQHDPGPGHPESVQRHVAITKALTEAGIVANVAAMAPIKKTEEVRDVLWRRRVMIRSVLESFDCDLY